MSLRSAGTMFLVAALLPSCFSEPESVDGTGGDGSSTGTDPTSTTTTSSEDDTSSSSGAQADSTSVGGDSTSTGDLCAPFILASMGEFLATDVALVVDTRPSMQDNAESVQGLMDMLPSAVGMAEDLHVALVADLDGGPCVPGPLGNDDCSDNSNVAAGYQRVNAETSEPSTDPLQVLLTSLEDGDVTVFRPDAQKHLVVMTDGDASFGVAGVEEQISQLGPSYQYARIHAVAGGAGGGTCAPADMLGAITEAFNGETVTMCPLEGAALLGALRARPKCVFDIPALPDGIEQAELVGVTLTGGGLDVELEATDDLAGCVASSNGVFIGGDRALLCRRTCATYQDAVGNNPGALEFEFSTCEP